MRWHKWVSDRRIDGSWHYLMFAIPTSRHAGGGICPGAISVYGRKCERGDFISFHLAIMGPGHPAQICCASAMAATLVGRG